MGRSWWNDRKFWLDWRAWAVLVAVSIAPVALWLERPAGAASAMLAYAVAVVVIGAIYLYWRDHRMSVTRSERRARRREERRRGVGFND